MTLVFIEKIQERGKKIEPAVADSDSDREKRGGVWFGLVLVGLFLCGLYEKFHT